MQEQRLRPNHFLMVIGVRKEVWLYDLVMAPFVSSQADSIIAMSSLPALACHLDLHSFTESTNMLLPGVTSTTQGAPSSSTGIPIITSIAPEATQGSDADGGMLGGSASEQESSGRSAEAAASSSGAMPADITGACSKGFPCFQTLVLQLPFLPCLLPLQSI